MSMAALTGKDAKRIWHQMSKSVFSDEMSIKIAEVKFTHLQQGDNTYFDLRNTATAKTLESIDYLIHAPGLTWDNRQDYVRSLRVIQQSFLYDRFCFVDDYLSKVGTREFFTIAKPEDFLIWGLLNVWELRLREEEWQ
jgi:hypothetical protein